MPEASAPVVKIVFDPASAEVRVVLRSGGRRVEKVILVEQDLSAALKQADTFIKENLRR